MTVSSWSSSGTSLSSVESTTAAGTMMQMHRGFSSLATKSSIASAPVAPSPSSAAIASALTSWTTQSWPPRISRRTMLAPMRPSPIMPTCICGLLVVSWSGRTVARFLPGGGQDDRFPGGHDERVLGVGGRRAVGGEDRPAVAPRPHVARAEPEDRLDRDDGPPAQRRVEPGHEDVRGGRLLVDRAPDPMAGELAQNRAATALGLVLHRPADRVRRGAGAGGGHAAAQGGLRGGGEARDPRRDPADGHADRRVGVVAVELGGDVELDELARPQPPRAGDPVHRLVVDADADRAGEAVHERGRGARAVAGENARGERVELGGRDARTDATGDLAQRRGDGAPGA